MLICLKVVGMFCLGANKHVLSSIQTIRARNLNPVDHNGNTCLAAVVIFLAFVLEELVLMESVEDALSNRTLLIAFWKLRTQTYPNDLGCLSPFPYRKKNTSLPKVNKIPALSGSLCFHHTAEDRFSSLSCFIWDLRQQKNSAGIPFLDHLNKPYVMRCYQIFPDYVINLSHRHSKTQHSVVTPQTQTNLFRWYIWRWLLNVTEAFD